MRQLAFMVPRTRAPWLIKTFVLLLVAIIFLALYGHGIDFVPSDRVSQVAHWIAIGLTAGIVVSCWDVLTLKFKFKRKSLQVVEWLFRVILIGYIIFVCFAYGLPGLHARLFGKLTANVQIVTPRENHASRECHFVIENRYLTATQSGHVCINHASYLTGEQVYILTGYQTSLGFYIKEAIPHVIFKKILKHIKQESVTTSSS